MKETTTTGQGNSDSSLLSGSDCPRATATDTTAGLVETDVLFAAPLLGVVAPIVVVVAVDTTLTAGLIGVVGVVDATNVAVVVVVMLLVVVVAELPAGNGVDIVYE